MFRKKKKKLVVITGGGTAGHTNPGIATAQALVEQGVPADSIHFIGGKRGNESTLVPAAGFSITALSGRGIQRKISFASLKAGFALAWGTLQGFYVMAKLRPKVVLCLGGYASFPASLAAIVFRRPLVVSEQNARSSAVNRFFARYAKVCALPFPNTDLPKGVLTGNPSRSGITRANKANRFLSREKFGIKPEEKLIAVWAGSLGAASVNAAVLELAYLWKEKPNVVIYHIVGRRYWDEYKSKSFSSADFRYETVAYEDDMQTLLQSMDIAICRSGASTISELAVVGIPSLLVPLPGAPRDHQTANTVELVDAGAAKVIPDAKLSGEKLAEDLDPLLANPEILQEMSVKAVSVARPEAAHKVADLLREAGDIEIDGHK